MITETITIIKISGNKVTYSGSEYFDVCHISNFPHTPKVGESFIITHDFINPSVITEM